MNQKIVFINFLRILIVKIVSTLLLCVNVAANDGDAILASFEDEETLDGWAVSPDSTISASVEQSTIGVTHGSHSLAITQDAKGWNQPARGSWNIDTEASIALEYAMTIGPEFFLLEYDVTFLIDKMPANPNWFQTHLAISNGGWVQPVEKLTNWSPADGDSIFRVSKPLSTWQVPQTGPYVFNFFVNYDANVINEPVTFYIDNIRLVRTGGIAETMLLDFEDETSQGWEFSDNSAFTEIEVTTDPEEVINGGGNASLKFTFSEGGWANGAALYNYDNPAIDAGLTLRMDFKVIDSGINQIFMVLQEPDSGGWHQRDQWFGGNPLEGTLEVDYKRTGTEPINLIIGRATQVPLDPLGDVFVVVDNIRVLEVLPYDAPAVIPFEIIEINYANDQMLNFTWNSVEGTFYAVDSSADLKNWEEVDDSILSEGTRTTFTNSTNNADFLYYRVRQLPGLP